MRIYLNLVIILLHFVKFYLSHLKFYFSLLLFITSYKNLKFKYFIHSYSHLITICHSIIYFLDFLIQIHFIIKYTNFKHCYFFVNNQNFIISFYRYYKTSKKINLIINSQALYYDINHIIIILIIVIIFFMLIPTLLGLCMHN